MENQMSNMPKVKIEIVAVSRDCFPESLSVNRRNITCKHFEGPKMFFAAAEERGDNLLDGRGDAYCGMLNASYNLKLYQSQELSLD